VPALIAALDQRKLGLVEPRPINVPLAR
jgi:hypothetical protein